MSYREMGFALNRPRASIQMKLLRLGLVGEKRLSPKNGERFDRLIVLGRSKTGGKDRAKTYYICQCDCGAIKEIKGVSLRSGMTKSCGCLHSERMKEIGRDMIGDSSYHRIEWRYRYNASKREMPWELTTECFRELLSQNCHWCGEEPKPHNPFYKKDGTRSKSDIKVSDEWAKQQWIMVNGVDRINSDPKIGYTAENCVPCCGDCNEMKMERSVNDFLSQVEKIHNFQQGKKK